MYAPHAEQDLQAVLAIAEQLVNRYPELEELLWAVDGYRGSINKGLEKSTPKMREVRSSSRKVYLIQVVAHAVYPLLLDEVREGLIELEYLPGDAAIKNAKREAAQMLEEAYRLNGSFGKVVKLDQAMWLLKAAYCYSQAYQAVEEAKATFQPYLCAGRDRMMRNRTMTGAMATLKSAGQYGFDSPRLAAIAFKQAQRVLKQAVTVQSFQNRPQLAYA